MPGVPAGVGSVPGASPVVGDVGPGEVGEPTSPVAGFGNGTVTPSGPVSSLATGAFGSGGSGAVD